MWKYPNQLWNFFIFWFFVLFSNFIIDYITLEIQLRTWITQIPVARPIPYLVLITHLKFQNGDSLE